MGTDKRIRDAAAEVSQADLKTLLASLYLAVDDASFLTDDAKKLLVNNLFTNTVVFADDTDNNYQGLTPKAFKLNVAQEDKKGIVEYATDDEIAYRSGYGVLRANKITELVNEIFKETIHIGFANKDTYISECNITISNCEISITRNGKYISISGFIDGSVTNTNVLSIKFVPEFLPIPNPSWQSFSSTAYYNSLIGSDTCYSFGSVARSLNSALYIDTYIQESFTGNVSMLFGGTYKIA